MREISFQIPEATPSLNVLRKLHYQAYKRLRDRIAWMVKVHVGNNLVPIKRCKIEIIRFGSRSLDWDNCYGGIKPLMDCLVIPTKSNPSGLGVILDDNPDVVVSLIMKQEKTSRKDEKTFVRIRSMQ